MFWLLLTKCRIAGYDAVHPYEKHRRRWMEARERAGLSGAFSFSDIYIDDAFGMPCVGPGEDIGCAHSRPRAHLDLVRKTFEGAGWKISVEKVQ